MGLPCRPYVLPESFVLPLVDSSDLGIEKPQGMVFVNLIEATDVPKMDLFSQSDGFVKCAPTPTRQLGIYVATA